MNATANQKIIIKGYNDDGALMEHEFPNAQALGENWEGDDPIADLDVTYAAVGDHVIVNKDGPSESYDASFRTVDIVEEIFLYCMYPYAADAIKAGE